MSRTPPLNRGKRKTAIPLRLAASLSLIVDYTFLRTNIILPNVLQRYPDSEYHHLFLSLSKTVATFSLISGRSPSPCLFLAQFQRCCSADRAIISVIEIPFDFIGFFTPPLFFIIGKHSTVLFLIYLYI